MEICTFYSYHFSSYLFTHNSYQNGTFNRYHPGIDDFKSPGTMRASGQILTYKGTTQVITLKPHLRFCTSSNDYVQNFSF
jgi:hypothetical protein